MKVAEWASEQGVSSRVAWTWFPTGTLPVPARQLDTGTILIDPPPADTGETVAYCRVSGADQRDDGNATPAGSPPA